MNTTDRIYVAGHNGLAGGAICRALAQAGYMNILVRSHADLDLCNQTAVNEFFRAEQPDIVILAAAKVGGIHANSTFPADFIRDNLLIQTHVLTAAHTYDTRKLLFLGSSCIYPRLCPQPISEKSLLTGPLEPTNEPYALAKIAGISYCRALRQQFGFDAIAAMPTNLYGPGDNFHPQNSHVLPALIRRFDEAARTHAPEVCIWGTGTPRREFLHVDDMAEACVFLLERYSDAEHVNVGCGEDMTILEIAELVAEATGFTGRIVTDPTKPDGTPQKLLDVRKINELGWKPRRNLRQGLAETVRWYREHVALSPPVSPPPHTEG